MEPKRQSSYSPEQERLLKTFLTYLPVLLNTEDEKVFFELSSELMGTLAALIKRSKFALSNTELPYDVQALEFALDCLHEKMHQRAVNRLDN